jgi:hypothetical protein
VSASSGAFTVLPGTYDISVSSGQCPRRSDTFTVNESESYKLEFACEVASGPLPQPRAAEGFLIVENQTGGPLQMTINGSTGGTRQVPPGTSTISLAPGSYNILVSAACGQKALTFDVRAGSQRTENFQCTVTYR